MGRGKEDKEKEEKTELRSRGKQRKGEVEEYSLVNNSCKSCVRELPLEKNQYSII